MASKQRRFSFVQLDVFSSVALEGNPLAVFSDARGLSDEQMQAVAREMNLSETTFVLPNDPAVERERGVRVRIFTVQESCHLQVIRRWEPRSYCANRKPVKSCSS
jgi:trans-2,3-dihydro-3-hydroxyanthranilate isomerase